MGQDLSDNEEPHGSSKFCTLCNKHISDVDSHKTKCTDFIEIA